MLLLAMFNVQCSIFNVQAQEAFYIYRNDGQFNGFFYDEVVRMGVSKTDLNGEEQDKFVVQEIETEDSLYRIPLSSIDSIGFQQPEIIINERFHTISASDNAIDDPYSWHNTYYWKISLNSEDYYSYDPIVAELYPVTEDMKVFGWEPRERNSDGTWGEYNEEKHLPKVGDILSDLWYSPYFCSNMVSYIVKVVAVIKYQDGNANPYYYVYCEPVDNFGDVFEQFVTVEQIGKDETGQAARRMAGMNKVIKRVSGNKDLSLISLNGSFPAHLYGGPNIDISLSLDLAIDVKARASYNISRKDYFINIEFEENAEAGATLSAKGTMEDVTTWKLGGAPIYFPSFLPILQVDPAPGAFLKTTGYVNLKLTTPKLAFHGKQNISISPKGIRGNRSESTGKNDPNNGWGLELSLNGSAHAGTHFPFNLETNTWLKKIFWCSTGIDVYVGPKLSASFTLDPVALANGENIYSTLGNTNISLSQVCAAYEATAKFSAGTKYEEEFKIFEGEANLATMQLKLFPSFDQTEIAKTETLYRGDSYEHLNGFTTGGVLKGYKALVNIKPRQLSVPFYVGAGLYSKDKELLAKGYHESEMYSFFNPYESADFTLPLYQGKFFIVPLINVLGYDVPAWSAAKDVESTLSVEVALRDKNGGVRSNGDTIYYGNEDEGYFYIYGIMPGDEVDLTLAHDDYGLEFEKVDQIDDYIKPLKIQRYYWHYTPVEGKRGTIRTTITVTGEDGSVRTKECLIDIW